MSTSEPRRAESLFYEALALVPAERAAFLDEKCGADPGCRAEVEDLLQSHDEAEGFLKEGAPVSPEAQTEFARLKPEEVGDRIGPYKLLEQIGEGGFGTVWVAEQEQPIRRRVALKIIKLGMDTKDVVARFEQERQALAMMDHANIAKVHDAGATPLGRPFFVMELVRGVKITEYCDQSNAPTAERLRLFIAVCQAVQHAHQKGIIHRDLKPSNILVSLHDGVPVPKVIDFGVAKATQQRLTELTIYTQFEQMIGTPLYMSPEQAELSGIDIDTRSDIYSLGVLLYELLTGRTPFDPQKLIKEGYDEVRRFIREEEPPKPSTLVSTLAVDARTTLAQHRQTDGAKLIGQIRGDLDWIVMKALEKDRARRYETANGLALDIERHLQNEPVLARPPGAGYRFRRFARRNKLAVGAAGAVLAALLIGLGVSTWMFLKEKHARERAVAAEKAQNEERKKAETEASKSRQIAQFLQDMLAGVAPSVALGRDTEMLREILDKTAQRLGNDLRDQPDVEADLRSLIGDVYLALGESAKAQVMHSEALAIRSRSFDEGHPDVASSLTKVATVLQAQGKFAEAEAASRRALAIARALGNEHETLARALSNLGSVLNSQGRRADAEVMHREALVMWRKLLGSEHPDVAAAVVSVGHVLWLQAVRWEGVLPREQALTEAGAMYREALEMYRKVWGDEHPAMLNVAGLLALLLNSQGKSTEAETMQRVTLERWKKLVGKEHASVGNALLTLAEPLWSQPHKLGEAETVCREALALFKKLFGDKHPHVARARLRLGEVLEKQQKLPEAEAVYREALALSGETEGEMHGTLARKLGALLEKQGRISEAGVLARAVLAIRRKSYGNEHSQGASTLTKLAISLGSQGKFPEAASMYREVLAMQRKLLGNEHSDVAMTLGHLGYVLVQQGNFGEAELIHREALAMRRKLFGDEHEYVAESLFELAGSLEKGRKLAEAESALREALAIERKRVGETDRATVRIFHSLARLLRSGGKLAEAESLHREVLAKQKKLLGNEHWVTNSILDLAGVLEDQGKRAGARELLRVEVTAAREAKSQNPQELDRLRDTLARTLYIEGNYSAGEIVYRELIESRQSRLGADADEVVVNRANLGRLLANWALREHSQTAEEDQPRSDQKADARPINGRTPNERAREAEQLLQDCLNIRQRGANANHWRTSENRIWLGNSMLSVSLTDPALASEGRLAKLAEAELLLLAGNKGVQESEAAGTNKRDALNYLVRFYKATADTGKLAVWQQKLSDFDAVAAKKRDGK